MKVSDIFTPEPLYPKGRMEKGLWNPQRECGCFKKKSLAISGNGTTNILSFSPHPSAYAVILPFSQSLIIKVVKDSRWRTYSAVYLHCSGDKIVSIVFILDSYVMTYSVAECVWPIKSSFHLVCLQAIFPVTWHAQVSFLTKSKRSGLRKIKKTPPQVCRLRQHTYSVH